MPVDVRNALKRMGVKSLLPVARTALSLLAYGAACIPSMERRYKIRERLNGPWCDGDGPYLWLHGASLGECRMLLSLAEALKKDWATCPQILLTTQKAEAVEPLKKLSRGLCEVAVAPADVPCAMEKFVMQVKPAALVLGENELWPGFVSAVNAFRGKPSVALVSGRVRRKPLWLEESSFGFAAIQTKLDLERLDFRCGVICGNWKLLSWAREQSAVAEVAGSCSEEALAVDVACISFHKEELESFCKLASKAVACQKSVVLAPRRLEDVELFRRALLSQKVQTTSWPCVQKSAVSVVDRFGVVPEILKACHVAVVGGSFHKSLGVHDFWEPLCAGVLTVVGPCVRGAECVVSDLVETGALVQIENGDVDFLDVEKSFNMDSIQSALRTQREKILNSYERLLKFLSATV